MFTQQRARRAGGASRDARFDSVHLPLSAVETRSSRFRQVCPIRCRSRHPAACRNQSVQGATAAPVQDTPRFRRPLSIGAAQEAERWACRCTSAAACPRISGTHAVARPGIPLESDELPAALQRPPPEPVPPRSHRCNTPDRIRRASRTGATVAPKRVIRLRQGTDATPQDHAFGVPGSSKSSRASCTVIDRPSQ
jgi:hypothetical protein